MDVIIYSKCELLNDITQVFFYVKEKEYTIFMILHFKMRNHAQRLATHLISHGHVCSELCIYTRGAMIV